MPIPESLLRLLKNRPPARTVGVAASRLALAQLAGLYVRKATLPAVAVQDIRLATPWRTGARIYTPPGAGPFPMFVYFHGGGWVRGDLDLGDGICASLARAACCIVVSIDYSLAPEVKFPGQVEEGYAAIAWLRERAADFHADPAQLAVGGDSSGANLAAALCLFLREQGAPPPVCQILFNPVLDLTADYQKDGPFSDPFLTAEDMAFYADCYLPERQAAANPLASPLLANTLAGLPPALIITADGDPLQQDGERYAARLREEGVFARLQSYAGVMHGFVSLVGLVEEADAAASLAAQYLGESFAGGSVSSTRRQAGIKTRAIRQ